MATHQPAVAAHKETAKLPSVDLTKLKSEVANHPKLYSALSIAFTVGGLILLFGTPTAAKILLHKGQGIVTDELDSAMKMQGALGLLIASLLCTASANKSHYLSVGTGLLLHGLVATYVLITSRAFTHFAWIGPVATVPAGLWLLLQGYIECQGEHRAAKKSS